MNIFNMETKTHKVVTLNRKSVMELPIGETILIQPNNVTNGKFDIETSIYKMKILIRIIAEVQDYIKKEMQGIRQDLFQEHNSTIELRIPFSDIAPKQRYADVMDSIESLRQITVKFPSKERKGYTTHIGLIHSYDVPTVGNGQKKYFFIKIHKEIGSKLITIDKDITGKPINYTKYFYEIAMSFKSSYTILLYLLISSWKKKGGFVISLDDLRDRLGIKPGQYKNYSNFKKIILERAQNEMELKSDCWFNCKASDFEIKKGKKVTMLNFKVINPKLLSELESRKHVLIDNIKHLLTNHFEFKTQNIKELQEIIDSTNHNIEFIHEKATFLMQYIKDNKVSNPINYFLKSFQNALII